MQPLARTQSSSDNKLLLPFHADFSPIGPQTEERTVFHKETSTLAQFSHVKFFIVDVLGGKPAIAVKQLVIFLVNNENCRKMEKRLFVTNHKTKQILQTLLVHPESKCHIKEFAKFFLNIAQLTSNSLRYAQIQNAPMYYH